MYLGSVTEDGMEWLEKGLYVKNTCHVHLDSKINRQFHIYEINLLFTFAYCYCPPPMERGGGGG